MDKVLIFRSLCNRRRHIAIHPVCQSCTKSEWLGMYCERSNWNRLWKKLWIACYKYIPTWNYSWKKSFCNGHWIILFLQAIKSRKKSTPLDSDINWSVQIQVSKFRFKTDIENPELYYVHSWISEILPPLPCPAK